VGVAKPFLHCHHRFKDGKDHCYWSIAEKVRVATEMGAETILYLGEINDSQKAAWTKTIEVFDTAAEQTKNWPCILPNGPSRSCSQWRASALERVHSAPAPAMGSLLGACKLWNELRMDEFWGPLLPASREGTNWKKILQTLTIYGCSIPAANGACIGSGSKQRPGRFAGRRFRPWQKG